MQRKRWLWATEVCRTARYAIIRGGSMEQYKVISASCQRRRLTVERTTHDQRCDQPTSTWTGSNASSGLQLGSLQLPSPILLSPLERISDVGFRHVCFHLGGAGLTWTEMVYCSELVRPAGEHAANYNHNHAWLLEEARRNPRGNRGAHVVDSHDPGTLTGVQLLVDRVSAKDNYGADLLQRALEQLHEGAASTHSHWRNLVAVDLNFGCPSPSISRRGAGPAQLRRRSKVKQLFQVLVDWKQANSSLPLLGAVGCKIRLGNNARERMFQVYLPVAEAAADCGLDYITVHARHGEQRSRDPVMWEAIAQIKECIQQQDSSDTKVIANGDVRTPADIKRIRQLTNCDGVMVGRAAMRNPWIFKRLTAAWKDSIGSEFVEWPTEEEVEVAAALNEAWSKDRPATLRYQRFREENWERLRLEARQLEQQQQQLGGTNAVSLSSLTSSSSSDASSSSQQRKQHSDWYLEWSQASTRRRHLDQLDDEAEASARDSGSVRRTMNPREWKQRQRRR